MEVWDLHYWQAVVMIPVVISVVSAVVSGIAAAVEDEED